jgi:tetratricopeptide (TPR) repeat protein
MASSALRMSLAVRQVDSALRDRARSYPKVLPVGHMSVLRGWEYDLKWEGGVLLRYTREEFDTLGPLERQLEVNRAHAEARLARARAGEVRVDPDEEEWLYQRAVGLLPDYEDQRLLEIVSCVVLQPEYMTSNPGRFLAGVALVQKAFGQATALGYGSLMMAGVRARVDLVKYGRRLEDIYERVRSRSNVAQLLDGAESGLKRLGSNKRRRLVQMVHRQLWSGGRKQAGTLFLLTQVIDGYLGLRAGGVGDSFGVAVLDGIIAAKFGFRVGFLSRDGYFYLAVGLSDRNVECWDPLDRDGHVPVGAARRHPLADLFIEGYLRLARGYVLTRSYPNVERVARWVLEARSEEGGVRREAEAFELLGISFVGQGQPRKAIDYCRRALSINPKLPEAYLVLGNAFSFLSRWPEAIAAYRKAVQLQVGYAEAYNNLGLALAKNAEPERAVGAYNQALRIRPEYVEAWYNLGNLLLEREEYAEAIDAYRHAVECNPRFSGAFYNMGQAQYRMGNPQQALEAYKSAVAVNPKHAGAWNNMGIVYRDLGEKDKAVEAIERAVKLNPILFR